MQTGGSRLKNNQHIQTNGRKCSFPLYSSKSYPLSPWKPTPRTLYYRMQRQLLYTQSSGTNNLCESFLDSISCFIRANYYCFIAAFSPKFLGKKFYLGFSLSICYSFVLLLSFKKDNSNALVISGIIWFQEKLLSLNDTTVNNVSHKNNS